MFVIAHAQGQKNQPAEQRQNKQQRRIVVQHMNGTAEDMPSQQDQAQQHGLGSGLDELHSLASPVRTQGLV